MQDLSIGFERCLQGGWGALAKVGLGLVLGWWLYVPIHELLHALGCIATGGQVSQLELDSVYGGDLLARLFPFVSAGSDYAGQLTGFDTKGSDFIYLATVFAPFLLTLWPGVWAMRKAGFERHSILFGMALPLALGPFLSLTGDAYEIGAILTTHIPGWNGIDMTELLRGDDLFRRCVAVKKSSLQPWGGLLTATLLGTLWAFLTYGLGAVIARWLGASRLREI
jgi:hypothetical protein